MSQAPRICSLLPSATEIVFSLGLGEQLVGVTHECDYPPEASGLPAVTSSAIDHADSSSREIHDQVSGAVHRGSSLYHLDRVRLESLRPDLLLTQELCDVCAVSYQTVEKAVRSLPGEQTVLSLEPMSLGGILSTIEVVGRRVGVGDKARQVVRSLQERIHRVQRLAREQQERPRVFAMEWLDPPFMGGHWIPEMIRLAGGEDGLGRQGEPSTQLSWEAIVDYDPEVVVLMPCGFGCQRSVDELGRAALPEAWHQLTAVQEQQVYAVDGSSYFNRPGPRIVDGLEILAEILHPVPFPRSHGSDAWRRLEAP